MTIDEVLIEGKKILIKNGVEDAGLISKVLLASILKCRKEHLIINYNKEISREEEKVFFCGIDKISNGVPLQYLTKTKEFMKMDFFVNENVLIPRADTEILVEEVIRECKENNKILELCTGSGVIAISLAKYCAKNIKIIATDISEKALEVARQNSDKLNEHQNIEFIKSNMFEAVEGEFDIIVSNPPYIKTNTIKKYNLQYEPQIALDRRRGWT